jgi:XTP/dITP diphosphohydrolase
LKKFIVATKNSGKLNEIKEILKDTEYDVVSMIDIGYNDEIEENGATFEENAMIKANALHQFCGQTVLADDSGLEVDALGGAPGIYTARFAGEGATDLQKIEKLLDLLKDVPFENRKARFVCSIALILENGEKFVVKETCEGYINERLEGSNGFGYDPIFYVAQYKKTMAQLDVEIKNSISHRGKALKKMLQFVYGRINSEFKLDIEN